MRTIYTAIFGNYDDLKDPFFPSQHWKYVCYTDQDFKSNVWEVRKVPVMECGPAKTARWYKINFHKHTETDHSMWIDGTFFINTDLNRWWRKRYRDPFTCVRHPYDDCCYTDAISCISSRRGDAMELIKQVAFYNEIGVPKNNGLISSGILMRKKEKSVIQFCETWWQQVEKFSVRDQIAYGYANWKHPNSHHTIDWNYQTQKEFIHCPHIYKPYREERKNEIIKKYAGLQSK